MLLIYQNESQDDEVVCKFCWMKSNKNQSMTIQHLNEFSSSAEDDGTKVKLYVCSTKFLINFTCFLFGALGVRPSMPVIAMDFHLVLSPSLSTFTDAV